MKSETEYETEKHGDVDVYKATTNVTYSKEELEEAIRLYVVITEKNAEIISRAFRNVCDRLSASMGKVSNILNSVSGGLTPVEDIAYLKKQIKHCKNPLEEKALQKRLNAALKKAKGKR